MRESQLAFFMEVRIVVRLDWYGQHLCFHIDPGDGSTIPIYLEEHRRGRRAKKVLEVQEGLVDLSVREVPLWIGDQPGVKRYLNSIKESNAR